MSPLEIAKEKLLAAALALVANRLWTDVREPSAHDDAQAEMQQDIFDEAVVEYHKWMPISA